MMKEKLKKIIIPFILMLIFNLGVYYLTYGQNFGEGLSPHVGILLISGLILGPYGAIGSVIGNFLCDLIRGYDPLLAVLSAIISFGISYLGYKLWYETYKYKSEVSRPKLNNTSNIILFIGIIILCGILYAILHGKLFYLINPETISINALIEIRYLLNFINSSFIFGIIGIWISNKLDFVHLPQASKSNYNKRFYKVLEILLIFSLALTLLIDSNSNLNNYIIISELIVISAILFIYLTKPFESDLAINDSKSISEEIMNIFHITILIIIILGILISYDHTLLAAVDDFLPLDKTEIIISMMILMDVLLLIFFIPSLFVLKYIEMKVIEPILSFSKIEKFIHENEKIESDGLVNIYSKYIDDETEIGTLARSYTNLIKFNNNYIENIQEIEGEKKRIEAELDIARKIQAANLPIEPIENDCFKVNGYSKPAKEVGGDFFDYYELDDEHVVIVIGDASGKGVPAAILAMISQVMIKQLLKHHQDPSRVLYLLNNQLCENNPETMFITLWLGIHNTTTKELTFSNAGHEPPLNKEDNEFKSLSIDSGLVLGIMKDFDFVTEKMTLTDEIILYTDGITDANNRNEEMYGEDKLLKFFNEFESENDPIRPLLDNIKTFTQDAEQFDDMTLLYLMIKDD